MKTAVIAASALLLTQTVPVAPAQPITARPIALDGDEAPGTGGGIFRFSIAPARPVSRDGQVAFNIRLVEGVGGVTGSNSEVVYRSTPEGLDLVARQGDLAPGADALLANFGNVVITPGGEAAFSAFFTGGDAAINGVAALYVTAAGEPSLIARSTQPAPGTEGRFGAFSFAGFPGGFDSNGDFAFFNQLEQGPNRSVLFASRNGELGVLVRPGDPVPDRPHAAFSEFGTPAVAEGGAVAFTAGATNVFGGVIAVVEPDGGTRLIASSGDRAPGTDGAELGFSLASPAISPGGDVAFLADLAVGVGDTTAFNDRAVFAEVDGELRLVARMGDVLPGAGPLDPLSRSIGAPSIADGGRLAFVSGLSRSTAVVATVDGELQVIAQSGQPVPGLPRSFYGSTVASGAIINNTGDVAFLARVTNGGVALMLYDALRGETRPIVVGGTEFNVSGDPSNPELRTVGQMFFDDSLFGDGMGGLGHGRDLAFTIFFNDATAGLFTVALPCNRADLALTGGFAGQLDGRDIAAFVASFLAGEDLADIDGVPGLTGGDIAAFISSFLAGCP